MTSKNPPKAYDETMLDALEKALKDVLEVLAAHYPEREWDDTDLKTALAGKLMAFADSGDEILTNSGIEYSKVCHSGTLTRRPLEPK